MAIGSGISRGGCKTSDGVAVLSVCSATCSAAAVGARVGVDGRRSGLAAGDSTIVGI